MITKTNREAEIQEILSSFCCTKDKDIEDFLLTKAVTFEKLGKARTYLVCSKEQLENSFCSSPLIIYGYISIALKVLSLSPDFSNRLRKELDGFSAKLHGFPVNAFPCYLIGQLSRNSNVSKSSLSGEKLLSFAYDIIQSAVDVVGGRYMMIECSNHTKLIQFYKNNHFQELNPSTLSQQPLVQMIRKL